MLCKFGPSYLRQGGHSADLKQAQQGVDHNPFTTYDNKRSYLECPYFELNQFARSTHGIVQFVVRGRMDEGLHNIDHEPPVEHEDDEVESTKGTINDPEDGFKALLQLDVLNNFLSIQVLGGTLRLTFAMEEVTKVDKIGERKLVVEIDHDYRLGCFLWQSRRVKTWNFGFTFQSLDKRNFAAALIQGLKGLNTVLTHDGTSLVSNPRTLYVGRRKLKIWIGTWNMGNAAIPEELLDGSNPIETWAMHHEPEKLVDFKDVFHMHELENDIYAFGVQEGHASVWPMVDEFMKSKNFTKVSSCQVGKISQSVYVRNSDVASVNNVQTQNEAFGFAGVGVNKGTAAIGLTFRNQPLLFITSHLAARASQERLRQRNYQAKLTLKRLGIGRIPSADVTKQYSTFWFGDFNYRVKSRNKYWPDEELHRDDIIEIIQSEDSERLRELFFDSDQLTIEKEKGMVFAGFEEDHPKFYPSYKYHHFDRRTVWEEVRTLEDQTLVGYFAKDVEPTELSRAMLVSDLGEDDPRVSGEEAEQHYYLSLSAKQREYKENKGQCPSWCDRILHKSLPTTQIVQKRYEAFDNIISSDHSPVAAEYEIAIPKSQAIMRCSSFRVGAIQFLDVEIGTMRDPSVSIKQLFLDDDYLEEGHRPSSYYDEEAEGKSLEERGTLAEQAYKRAVMYQNKARNRGRKRAGKGTQSNRFSIRQGRTFTSVSSSTSARQQSSHSKVQGKMSSTSFFGEEDVDQEESEVDNMPHSSKLLLAAQAPFLSYASIRRVLSSSYVDARTSRHTFLPMYPPYRIGELGEDCEFRWKTDDLYKMAIGPFLTSCEFLSTQYVVLHVLPKLPVRGIFNDSIGSCTIRLNEAAFGEVVHFQEELHHLGSIIGTIRGRFRVLWDDKGWDKNVNGHPLNYNNLHKIPVPPKERTQQKKDFRFTDEFKSTEVHPVLYTEVKGEIFGQSTDMERVEVVVQEELEPSGPTKLTKGGRSSLKASNSMMKVSTGKSKEKKGGFIRMGSFNRSEKLRVPAEESFISDTRFQDVDDERFQEGEHFEGEGGDSSDDDDKMTQIGTVQRKRTGSTEKPEEDL